MLLQGIFRLILCYIFFAKRTSSNGIEKYPKLRFPEFTEPWSHIMLSDFAERIMRKNKNNETDLPLTISSKDGLVDQISFFNKTVASKDMSGYYLLLNGEFAYNKSYSVGYDFGSIKRLERYPMGALSTLYICFALKKYNSDFIKTYFDSLKWYKEIYMISAEGARNHGLLNVPTDEFFDTFHYITESKAEQEKIAKLMELIEQRISKQQALVDNLKKYKRGVVSKLISGTLAFDDSSDMVLKRVGDFCEVQMCKRIFKEQTSPIGEVPFYKIGTIGSKPDAYITRTLYDEYRKKYSFPRKGEFLISCAGTVGKCVLYNGEDSYYQDSNIVWLRNNSEDVTNEYLYVLVSNVDWSTLNSTTITRIYNDNLRDLSFYIPSVQMQHKITSFIFALTNRINKEQETLEKIQQEKDGLLQQLFI